MIDRFFRLIGGNLLWLFGMLMVLSLVGVWFNASSLYADNTRLVRVFVDGKEKTIRTDAKTVGEVLDRVGVEVSSSDLVEPGLFSNVNDEQFHINVFRAKPIMIVDGEKVTITTSPYSNPKLTVAGADIEIYDEDLFKTEVVTDFVEDKFVGIKITIDRAKPVSIAVDGQNLSVRTQAETVGELLEEQGMVLGKDDIVEPEITASIEESQEVKITRVGYEVAIEETVIPHSSRVIYTTQQEPGYESVQQAGQDGRTVTTYKLELRNGEIVGREKLQEVEVSKLVEEVVIKGTTYAGNIWHDLRVCETGGRYDANTGNGYYGAYQFMIETWNSIARRHRPDLVGVRPDLAAPHDQDELVARNVMASKGGFGSQHPGCAKKLGLPKYPPAEQLPY